MILKKTAIMLFVIYSLFQGSLHSEEGTEEITNINIYDINLEFPILKKICGFGFFCIDKYDIRFPENNDIKTNPSGLYLESDLRKINNTDYAFFKLVPESYNRNLMFTWKIPRDEAEDKLLNGSFNELLELSVQAGKRDINEVIFNSITAGNIQAAEPVYNNPDIFFNGENLKNPDPENNEISGYKIKIKSRPSQTHRFFRTLGELLVLNSFGVINYWVNKDENVEDWEYKPTKEGLKKKITDGWSLDTNAFRTNTIYHIYAGNVYFQAARSNEYGFAASVAWALTGSLIWEYVGEFREQVSTNDLIFTTMGGSLVGETLRQGSIFIEQNVGNKIARYVFMTLLDPMRIINRAIDRCFYDDIDVSVTFINPVLSMLHQAYDQQYFAKGMIHW